MFEALKNLVQIHEKAMQQLQAEGEAALREVFKDFFAEFPVVTAIRWAQYTPYFNDGEACVFSVHEPSLRTDADFLEVYDREFDSLPAPVIKAHAELTDLLQSDALERVLLAMFGDHNQVTVYPKQIVVDGYSHD